MVLIMIELFPGVRLQCNALVTCKPSLEVALTSSATFPPVTVNFDTTFPSN